MNDEGVSSQIARARGRGEPGLGRCTLKRNQFERFAVSTIDIHAHHALAHEEAREAAEDLSRDLARKFSIQYQWDGDCIFFERPGVHGEILVAANELHIKAHLGFMLMMLKHPIEQEVVRYLKEHFGCRFD